MLQDRNSTLQSVVPLVQGFARSLDAPPVSGMLSFATQVPPFPLDLIRGGNIFNRRAFIVGRSLLGVGMFILLSHAFASFNLTFLNTVSAHIFQRSARLPSPNLALFTD